MQLKTQTILNLSRKDLEEILKNYFEEKYEKKIIEMDYVLEEHSKLNNSDEEDFEEEMILSSIVLKLEEQILTTKQYPQEGITETKKKK